MYSTFRLIPFLNIKSLIELILVILHNADFPFLYRYIDFFVLFRKLDETDFHFLLHIFFLLHNFFLFLFYLFIYLVLLLTIDIQSIQFYLFWKFQFLSFILTMICCESHSYRIPTFNFFLFPIITSANDTQRTSTKC